MGESEGGNVNVSLSLQLSSVNTGMRDKCARASMSKVM